MHYSRVSIVEAKEGYCLKMLSVQYNILGQHSQYWTHSQLAVVNRVRVNFLSFDCK